jgi:hypothetical protein
VENSSHANLALGGGEHDPVIPDPKAIQILSTSSSFEALDVSTLGVREA